MVQMMILVIRSIFIDLTNQIVQILVIHYVSIYESNKTNAYTTGVTTNGTPGQVGAYTQIAVINLLQRHYTINVHNMLIWVTMLPL